MSVEGAVVTRLEAFTGVTDRVGSGSSSRIYPNKLPQEPTLEAMTYQIIDDVPEHAMGSDPGVAHARLQLGCWGNNYTEARELAIHAHAALSRFSGTLDETTIQDIRCMNRGTDGYADVPEEDRVVMDFMIDYVESVTTSEFTAEFA